MPTLALTCAYLPDKISRVAADGLGLRIKQARGRKHLTQRELASLLEVDRKTVDNWENERTRPSVSRVAALEVHLGSLDSSDLAAFVPADDDEARIWAMNEPEEFRRKLIDWKRRSEARAHERHARAVS